MFLLLVTIILIKKYNPLLNETTSHKLYKCEIGKPSNQKENAHQQKKKHVEVFNSLTKVRSGVRQPKHGIAA